MPNDPKIVQLLNTYRRLVAAYQARRISNEQFVAEMQRLRVQDRQGVWWTVDGSTGQLLYYDGAQWTSPSSMAPGAPRPQQTRGATPFPAGAASAYPGVQPASAVQPAAPSAQVSRQPVGQAAAAPPQFPGAPIGGVWSAPSAAPSASPSAARRVSNANPNHWRARMVATPFLTLVPAAACGGLWFLYTFLGAFKGEGLVGIDFITPLLVVGIPGLLWAFHKPLDRLLRPLNPLYRAIPRPLRLGIALAVPIALSCCFSTVSTYGYGALRWSTFLSLMTVAIMTREPGGSS